MRGSFPTAHGTYPPVGALGNEAKPLKESSMALPGCFAFRLAPQPTADESFPMQEPEKGPCKYNRNYFGVI